jgi:hypothetical protein
MMIDTGKGGGGPCWACSGARECKEATSGWATCKVEADSSGVSCTASGRCGTGSPFQGVVVLARTGPPETDESKAVGERINRYFRSDVIPRVHERWGSLQGRGVIVMRHRYRRQGSRHWVPLDVELFGDLLPEDELPGDLLDSAVSYMREGVDGTSFPVDEWDGDEEEFVLFWGWPVPFPAEEAGGSLHRAPS